MLKTKLSTRDENLNTGFKCFISDKADLFICISFWGNAK